MKTILALLIITALLASGCSTISKIKVPPGSLTSWTHLDNYGPVQSSVIVTGVSKSEDGSFTILHYDGRISYLGFGPHDVIEGLHIDATGIPTPSPVIVTK